MAIGWSMRLIFMEDAQMKMDKIGGRNQEVKKFIEMNWKAFIQKWN
jgi:hypothetical protein